MHSADSTVLVKLTLDRELRLSERILTTHNESHKSMRRCTSRSAILSFISRVCWYISKSALIFSLSSKCV